MIHKSENIFSCRNSKKNADISQASPTGLVKPNSRMAVINRLWILGSKTTLASLITSHVFFKLNNTEKLLSTFPLNSSSMSLIFEGGSLKWGKEKEQRNSIPFGRKMEKQERNIQERLRASYWARVESGLPLFPLYNAILAKGCHFKGMTSGERVSGDRKWHHIRARFTFSRGALWEL